MQEVTVNKSELISELKKNKAQHEKDLKLAFVGYKEVVIEKLEKKIKAIKAGKLIQQVYFDIPENHTKDYDRAIRMCEMSVDLKIKLTQQDFNKYVMDEWGWKDSFMTSNSTYFASASSAK
jgi:hypothetical protein